METSAEVINELKDKIGFRQTIDFMHLRKGVPVVFKGRIQEVRETSILLAVEPPDSICLLWDEQTTLLHDVFMSGILARVVHFDPGAGIVELDQLAFADRGFGDRSMVRVEPEDDLPVTVICEKGEISGLVADVSLTGFGILAVADEGCALIKGDQLTLKLSLLGQDLEISAKVLGVFERDGQTRFAVSFPQNTPGHAIIMRYISIRRAEIRAEIRSAYEQALGDDA